VAYICPSDGMHAFNRCGDVTIWESRPNTAEWFAYSTAKGTTCLPAMPVFPSCRQAYRRRFAWWRIWSAWGACHTLLRGCSAPPVRGSQSFHAGVHCLRLFRTVVGGAAAQGSRWV